MRPGRRFHFGRDCDLPRVNGYSWLRRLPDDEPLPVEEPLPDAPLDDEPLPPSLRDVRPLLDMPDPLDDPLPDMPLDEPLPDPECEDPDEPLPPDHWLSSPRRIRNRLSMSFTPGIESTISSIMYFE